MEDEEGDFEVLEDNPQELMRDEVMTLPDTEYSERDYSVRSVRELTKAERLRLVAEYRKKIRNLVKSREEEELVLDHLDEDTKSAYDEYAPLDNFPDEREADERELSKSTSPQEHDVAERLKLLRKKKTEEEREKNNLNLLLELLASTVDQLQELAQREQQGGESTEEDREGWTLFSRLQVLLRKAREVPTTVTKLKKESFRTSLYEEARFRR